MPDDPDVSISLTGWVPELELGDVARRLQKIYEFLAELDTTYKTISKPLTQLVARIEVNAPSLLEALKEMVDRVQRQDSLDIGDPDINEEVAATLQNMAINVESAANSAKLTRQSLVETAGELDEIRETIADLAAYVTDY